MYIPQHFAETRPEVLHALIEAHPLAAVVTHAADGLAANHIPLLLDADAGVLRGHMARANTQWRSLEAGSKALAIFQGPQAYISPNWYASKEDGGRVVPTWNYAVVHVHGTLTVFAEGDRLLGFLETLTARHEAPQPRPWAPSDAPQDYIAGLLNAIVGIELAVEKMEGKWKVSQNQPERNRLSAMAGLIGAAGD